MTDGPQVCALPGCSEIVEQPDDGGPRRLYCSPAHRAAARKARHAARMEAATTSPAAEATQTDEISQPIPQAPDDPSSEQPTTELPAPFGGTREEEPEPAPVPDREWSPAAAWTVSPPTLPATPSARTIRTITSKRVKKEKPARTAAERRNAATHMRRRAIASVAIASLVAGGASYFVTNNVIPTTPTPLPPQAANDPSMDADVWAGKAEVVLASLSSQLDAVAQAEASWLALPEQRRTQEPAAVQALKDRKALLEQQRSTLMSQLEAFKTLPDRTAELTSAQAQLDAVERTLNESTTTAASPDYQEALRQLESQLNIRREQRDHAAQALTDLRNGVEQALSSPLPADKDETAPIVERVKAVVAGRPDPGEKKDDDQEHKAADGQDQAATPRREDGDQERGDAGTTAPPDPERPNAPDILADGGSQGSNGSDTNAGNSNAGNSNGGDKTGGNESEGPVQSVASALGSAVGQGDTSNRDESANRRDARADDSDDRGKDNGERHDERGGLGNVVRGVGGALLGGSSRDDDSDDSDARREQSKDRDEGRDDDEHDNSSWFSDRGDRDDDDRDDDRGNKDRDNRDDDESDHEDDDHGGLRGITDRLTGGDDEDDDEHGDNADRDEDGDHRRPSGKAERKRDKDREESENRHHDSDNDDEHADDDDGDRKRPSGKAERKRDKDREESENRHHDSDDDSDKNSDHGDKDDDGDDDGGKSDEKSDNGGDDDDDGGGDSDSGDSGGGDDD